MTSHYDFIIVGARIAGAGLALRLAQAGRRVLVIDRSAPGTDTMSTHAIMRPGVQILHQWGVLDRIRFSDTPAIRKTTFHYVDTAIPVDIQPRDGVDALYAPRRAVIDSILVDAARDAGAEFRFRTSLNDLIRDAEGRVCGASIQSRDEPVREVSASWVIGADGAESTVAQRVRAPIHMTTSHAGSVLYGYFGGLRLDGTHWFYGKETGAGAIPTNNGEACVFVSSAPDHPIARGITDRNLRFRALLRHTNPRFADTLEEHAASGPLFRFAGRRGFLRQPLGPGWALIGDASCFKDPITAHGMTDALRDAHLLAQALLDGTLEALTSYASFHNQFARTFIQLTDEIAAYDWTLDALQQKHRTLSQLMNEEYNHILQNSQTAPLHIA